MGGSGGRGGVMLRAFLLAVFVVACPVHAGFDAHAGAADVPTPPAQARPTVRILDAPAGWAIEQIPIPLGFAPSLGFTGLEDVRFAPGWSASGSPEFWTYKFAWEIAEDPRLDEERLALILETYYDGLSRAVSQLGDSLQAPAAVFVRDGDGYRGRLRIYDAFATPAQRSAFRAELRAGLAWGEAKQRLFDLIDGEIGPTKSDLHMLDWLRENSLPVFVVATANRVDALPPELLRRGRLDELFFVDLPSADSRATILAIHLETKPARLLGHVPPLADPREAYLALARAAEGFSGAELEAALIEALLAAFARGEPLAATDLADALAATIPLARSHAFT